MCLVLHSTHTNERYNDQHQQQQVPHSGRQQHASSCVGRCVQACVVCHCARWMQAFSQHGHRHRSELVVAIDAVVPPVSQQLHALCWRRHCRNGVVFFETLTVATEIIRQKKPTYSASAGAASRNPTTKRATRPSAASTSAT